MTSGDCTASDAGKSPRPPSDFPKTLDLAALLLAHPFGPAASGRSNDWNPGIFSLTSHEPNIVNTSNSESDTVF